jgi:lipoate-protein ligase A
VLDRLAMIVGRCVPGLTRAGTSDLVLGNCKVSGNSLRCQRTHLLYHGTLIYDMRLELVERYLNRPPREPDYRGGRGHRDFLTRLPMSQGELIACVVDAFEAHEPLTDWPRARVEHLVAERYGRAEWNQ